LIVVEIGDALKALGLAVMVGGLAVWLGCFVLRWVVFVYTRRLSVRLIAVGFYAQMVALLGPPVLITGLVLSGGVPWPFLVLAVLFRAGPAALLATRPVSFQNGRSDSRPEL
jgi:hypothetical protein